MALRLDAQDRESSETLALLHLRVSFSFGSIVAADHRLSPRRPLTLLDSRPVPASRQHLGLLAEFPTLGCP
jgi:hypothetical protein